MDGSQPIFEPSVAHPHVASALPGLDVKFKFTSRQPKNAIWFANAIVVPDSPPHNEEYLTDTLPWSLQDPPDHRLLRSSPSQDDDAMYQKYEPFDGFGTPLKTRSVSASDRGTKRPRADSDIVGNSNTTPKTWIEEELVGAHGKVEKDLCSIFDDLNTMDQQFSLCAPSINGSLDAEAIEVASSCHTELDSSQSSSASEQDLLRSMYPRSCPRRSSWMSSMNGVASLS